MAPSQYDKVLQTDIGSIYTSYNSFIDTWYTLSTSGGSGCGYSACSYTKLTKVTAPGAGTVVYPSAVTALNNLNTNFKSDAFLSTQSSWWQDSSVTAGNLLRYTDLNNLNTTKSKFASVKCRNTATNTYSAHSSKSCTHSAHSSKSCTHGSHSSKSCTHSTHSSKSCTHSTHSSKSCTHSTHSSKSCSYSQHSSQSCNPKTCSNYASCSFACSKACSSNGYCNNACSSQSCTRTCNGWTGSGWYLSMNCHTQTRASIGGCPNNPTCSFDGYTVRNSSSCWWGNGTGAYAGWRWHQASGYTYVCNPWSGCSNACSSLACGSNGPCNNKCSSQSCTNTCGSYSCAYSSNTVTCSKTCSGQACSNTCSGQACSNTCSGLACSNTCSGLACSNTCSGQACSNTCSGQACVNTTTKDITCLKATNSKT